MNIKNQDEYIKELKNKNPTVELIDHYNGLNKKVKHFCIIHKKYWDVKPASVLKGAGCPICHTERISKSKTKTQKSYENELSIIQPHIKIIGKYINAKTPIEHYCTLHLIKWKATPSNVLSGCGCVECGKEKISNKNKKKNETYLYELQINDIKIKPLEKYITSLTPIKHQCLKCNYEWFITPANILSGKQCPKCVNNFKRTTEEYKKELSILNPFVEVIGEYINRKTPILHKCLIHQKEWYTTPSSVLQGCGCKLCAIHNVSTKTTEEYIKELAEIDSNIIVIDKYVNSLTPILHKCKIDGTEWFARPSSIIYQNSGCPICSISHGEKLIKKWLYDHSIEYISQYKFPDCKDIRALPFDFYLPILNKCIEYDGKQHFQPIDLFGGEQAFYKRKEHDQIKNDYCKKNNISLLRISYKDNIEDKLNNFLFI